MRFSVAWRACTGTSTRSSAFIWPYTRRWKRLSHGNAGDAGKHVRFVCRISPGKIRIEITDEGPGFDPDDLPDPTSPPRIGRPGGRGVLLMRAFMSHVEFQHGGSRVVLEKERPCQPDCAKGPP